MTRVQSTAACSGLLWCTAVRSRLLRLAAARCGLRCCAAHLRPWLQPCARLFATLVAALQHLWSDSQKVSSAWQPAA
eukprot:9743951-Alexandrium_andersonii.AAC.1